ncbi:MAG: DUF4445 domain-containing protein [Clostridia bacterium]|nr:DUF4445 domain-containing protein [Clostridia bacterium]
MVELKRIGPARCGAARDCSDCPAVYCPRRGVYSEDIEIVSDHLYAPERADGIAIDIGTTTVAAARYENGRQAESIRELNAGIGWGADVISRIGAAGSGAASDIKTHMLRQIGDIIERLGGEGHKIVVAANTAMTCLLRGEDVSGLLRYPFSVPSLDTIIEGHKTIIGGIGAFVGGDIVSGLYMCGFDKSDDINMLIDLGTNGEIAIGNKNGIICTSAAAGPAFEGGGISCGMGTVPGAICSVSLDGGIVTIGDEKPKGVCGTGIVELLYELIRTEYMDNTGLLAEQYRDGYPITDDIILTQKDIRAVQTAKSAIRAACEIVMKEYGAPDIKNVYIAGGFGRGLDIKKACGIGLLPEELESKCVSVGNSSLGGAVKLLDNDCNITAIEEIRSAAESFDLAERPEFFEMFLKYMDF